MLLAQVMLQKPLNGMELSINFSELLIKPKLLSQTERFRGNWVSLQDSNLNCTMRSEDLEKKQMSLKQLIKGHVKINPKRPLVRLRNFIIFCDNRNQKSPGSDLNQ